MIVSGLVGHYKPEDLTGKLVVIAANLKPKPFAGVNSHGMVVCASTGDKSTVEILEPPAGAKPGERVTFAGGCRVSLTRAQGGSRSVCQFRSLPTG